MKNSTKIVYIIGVIALICLVLSLFAYKFLNTKIIDNNSINSVKGNFYEVDLSLNPGILEPRPYSFDRDYGSSELGNYLIDILEIAKPTDSGSFSKYISTIAYKMQLPNNKFNATYFILLEPTLNPGKIYKNNEFTAKVLNADSKLLPFILDPSYCEVDNDCSLGSNFCYDGSYNEFRTYKDVWGCEGPTGATKAEWEMCGVGKYPVVKFSGGSNCINNKCVAQNRRMTCLEGELP